MIDKLNNIVNSKWIAITMEPVIRKLIDCSVPSFIIAVVNRVAIPRWK